MIPSAMREVGTRIASFLEKEAREASLDDENMLILLLTVTWGWAEVLGLDPKNTPSLLFERAARVWDGLSNEKRVEIVTELRRMKDGSFRL